MAQEKSQGRKERLMIVTKPCLCGSALDLMVIDREVEDGLRRAEITAFCDECEYYSRVELTFFNEEYENEIRELVRSNDFASKLRQLGGVN